MSGAKARRAAASELRRALKRSEEVVWNIALLMDAARESGAIFTIEFDPKLVDSFIVHVGGGNERSGENLGNVLQAMVDALQLDPLGLGEQ